ncbi:MAG: superoxide dismutase [Thermoleophilia bacterium]|nr:superoxide dismutase [Thermoleophilia bacterium]
MTEAPLWKGDIKTITWNDAWTKLEGISEKTMREHWKLYEGYVGKWKEIEGKLALADTASANQIFSDWRALKVDLSFAIGGVKNHQLYFGTLGGNGAAPTSWIGEAIDRQWGSYDKFVAEFKATGLASRGWAYLAYDWDTGLLGIYAGDAQNTFPIWNASLLLAPDVYEHAYFADFGVNRAAYIDAWFKNLDWSAVDAVVAKNQIADHA